MSLIDDIHTAYPAPMIAQPQSLNTLTSEQCYCVGGAILLYHDYTYTWAVDPRFPTEDELAEVLEHLTDKYEEGCDDWASAILDANDKGDFAKAWTIAAKALDMSKIKH